MSERAIPGRIHVSSQDTRLDIYRKVPKDLTQPTYTGAIISVSCCLFILFLFLSELMGFINIEIANELYVDDPEKSTGKIEVSINISLPNLNCEVVGLDIQDEMGRHEVGHLEDSEKIVLDEGRGCRFQSNFHINKVPGNFHVSTHSAARQPDNPDMSHVLHKLTFGKIIKGRNILGAFNALENTDHQEVNSLVSHDYVLKIVPTVYEDLRWTTAGVLPIHFCLQGVHVVQPYRSNNSCHLVPL
uniref:Endoplasmic reticulum-Golgi intermediate compartment protein n=1 Tax=Eptatretus burgeri TaxID=7764 RepID=A0A8C4R3P9_EPTBU